MAIAARVVKMPDGSFALNGEVLKAGDRVSYCFPLTREKMWMHGRVDCQEGKWVFLWANIDGVTHYPIPMREGMTLRRIES